MRFVRTTLTVLAVGLTCGVLSAETLQEVEKKITDEMTKHKSVQLKMKTKMDIESQGMVMKSTSESTAVYGKKGDKWLSRTDTKMNSVNKMGDNPEVKEDSKITTVYDGTYIYTLTESSQGKQAMKMKPERTDYDPFNGKQMWEDMHKVFDIKLLPDETIEGKSTWVIEARAKADPKASAEEQDAMKKMRTVTNYSKSDGVAVKSVSYDEKGNARTLMTTTDVKYDVDLKADAFKFTPPAGVEVMDMSQQAAAVQDTDTAKTETPETDAQGSPEPQAEQKPQAEAKKEEAKPKQKEKGAKGLLNRLRR